MNLADITPMILTYNEQDNLRSTLAGLSWANQILIVDSNSSDGTRAITAQFPQARVIDRPFDHFADQCNFGLSHICTTWALSLDADYLCNQGFADELARLDGSMNGYEAAFQYGIFGKPLRATLYPPRVVLYKVGHAVYHRDGHAHRVKIDGPTARMQATILHDDRKPIAYWFASQIRYAKLEADKLTTTPGSELSWKDRLRLQLIFAPTLTLFYCLFAKGLIFDGWRGVYYSLQRVFAELVLSLTLLDRRLRGGG